MQSDGRINSEKHQVIPEWIFYIENNNKVSVGGGVGGVIRSLQRITTERAEAAREIKRIL